MSSRKFFLTYALFFLIIACKPSKENNGLSLMKYGIPYTLDAPGDVVINKIGSGSLADVNLKNNAGYDVQIFMGSAQTTDMIKLKQLKKEAVIAHPEFSKIVEEYDSGFLFEKKSESTGRSFDFSIVKIIGDKEISFEAGNSKPFNEQEVKAMVKSILSIKN